MRRYETICILRPTLAEEQINTLVENTTTIIQSDGGRIIELDKWGLKKLSYPIKKETLGYYVYYDFAGFPDAVAEMERKFRIDDSVLRYLTVKTSDALSAEEAEAAITSVADRKAAAALATASEDEGNPSNETDPGSDADED